MLKKLLSIFVLLTIVVGSARADVSWDFTNSNDHNLSKNGVTLSASGSWGFNNGGFQFRATGATLSIPVTQGQIVTMYLMNPNANASDTKTYQFSVTGVISNAPRGISFTQESSSYRYKAQYKAISSGNIVITNTRNLGVIETLSIQDENNVIHFSKNGDAVTSDVAEFIELNYQEPVLMGVQQGDDVTYRVENVEGGRIASFLDSHQNDIMFINCGVCDVYATVRRYGNVIAEEKYRLTIQADNATYELDGYTYTLTGNGKLLENVVRNQVPKITMSFGNPDLTNPNATMVRYNDGGSTPVGTILDENGWRQIWMNNVQQDGVDKLLPYQGSFYKFVPETDGLLTVRGFFNSTSNTAYFVDANNLAPAWEYSKEFLTNKVDKTWGNIGQTDTQYAPAVEVAGDHNQHKMREKFKGSQIFIDNTQITQTVTDLPNGTYKLVVYANAMLTNPRDGIKGTNNYSNTNATVNSDDNVAEIWCQNSNSVRVIPGTGTSVASNGEYTIDNINVSNNTLTIDLRTHVAGDGARGVNWISIQIKSLEMHNHPAIADFTPIRTISAESATAEVVTEDIELKKGHTYYLYGNTPNTNGGGWLTYQLHSFTFIPGIIFATWSYVLG